MNMKLRPYLDDFTRRTNELRHLVADRLEPVGDRLDDLTDRAPEPLAGAITRTRDAAEKLMRQIDEFLDQAETEGRDEVAHAAGAVAKSATKLKAAATQPGSGVDYEDWTKAQLYDRAQDLDIEGRSSMSKRQLIKALRAAS